MKFIATASNGTNSQPARNQQPPPQSQQQQQQQPAAPHLGPPFNPDELIPIQITMPMQPNDPNGTGVQRSITIQVPGSCIQNNKLQVFTSICKLYNINTDE